MTFLSVTFLFPRHELAYRANQIDPASASRRAGSRLMPMVCRRRDAREIASQSDLSPQAGEVSRNRKLIQLGTIIL
jgi:hypothetical protein